MMVSATCGVSPPQPHARILRANGSRVNQASHERSRCRCEPPSAGSGLRVALNSPGETDGGTKRSQRAPAHRQELDGLSHEHADQAHLSAQVQLNDLTMLEELQRAMQPGPPRQPQTCPADYW